MVNLWNSGLLLLMTCCSHTWLGLTITNGVMNRILSVVDQPTQSTGAGLEVDSIVPVTDLAMSVPATSSESLSSSLPNDMSASFASGHLRSSIGHNEADQATAQ
jgi:hypothetical protein